MASARAESPNPSWRVRRARRRMVRKRLASWAAEGWCTSVGPVEGFLCDRRAGHGGNHRVEDALDPVVIEEWCDPRRGERYDYRYRVARGRVAQCVMRELEGALPEMAPVLAAGITASLVRAGLVVEDHQLPTARAR